MLRFLPSVERFGPRRAAWVGAHHRPLRVAVAQSSTQRMVGLLGTSSMAADHALLLVPCSAVHAIGMRFSLGVAFLDRAGRVMRVVDPLPARGARCRGAHGVLEAASGVLTDLRPGDAVHVDGERIFPLAPNSAA